MPAEPVGKLRRGSGRNAARRDGLYGFDDGTAEASVALVDHGELPRRDRPLRLLEDDPGPAVGPRLEQRGLVGLPVAHLHGAGECLAPGLAQPVQRTCRERRAEKQRMIVPLDDDQGIAARILARDEPRQLRAAGPAADPEPLALP